MVRVPCPGSDLHVHVEAVVLGGDRDPPGVQVLDGMISAMVPELQLVCFSTQGKAEHLLPKADSEHRHLPDQFFDRFDHI